MQKYKLVTKHSYDGVLSIVETLRQLEIEIEFMLTRNWQLIGGLCMTYTRDNKYDTNGILFAQAMTRNEE